MGFTPVSRSLPGLTAWAPHALPMTVFRGWGSAVGLLPDARIIRWVKPAGSDAYGTRSKLGRNKPLVTPASDIPGASAAADKAPGAPFFSGCAHTYPGT